MRQLHVFDCAPTAVVVVRVALATMLVTGGLVLAFVVVLPASAEPETCPPVCDQIPNTAWIGQRAVPLNSVYNWPALAGLAVQVTGSGPRSRFEELCGARRGAAGSPRLGGRRSCHGGPPGRAVAITGRRSCTGAVIRHTVVRSRRRCSAMPSPRCAAASWGRRCSRRRVTVDEPNRMAAVISGPVLMHSYLVAHPASSTISELTLWSSGPPQVPWPSMADNQVLDAMTAPLCDAYIASCP